MTNSRATNYFANILQNANMACSTSTIKYMYYCTITAKTLLVLVKEVLGDPTKLN